MKLSRVIVLGFVWLAVGNTAWADDLLPAGIHPKLSAGAGQTVSRGPSALFYNPANLIFSKFVEPYLDVSFATVDYSYQPIDTNFDPVVKNTSVPSITGGLGLRLIPSFAVGVAILPTSSGSAEVVENLPVTVSGTTTPLTETTTETSMRIAAGAAYRFAHAFTAGMGMIYNSQKIEQVATDPANNDVRIYDYRYLGTGNEFSVGMRSEMFDRKLVLALSYKTSATLTYTGDVCFLCDTATDSNGDLVEEYVTYEGVGYLPAAIGVGGEFRAGIFGAYVDVVYEQWSAGKLVYKRGDQADPESYDLIDALNIAGGTKLWFGKHMLTGGFGLYPSNIGDGSGAGTGISLLQDSGTGDGRVGGMEFGDVEAIPLTVFSGGYRYKIQGHGYTELGAYYASGSRDVPEGFDAAGSHTLSVLMFSAGVAFGF